MFDFADIVLGGQGKCCSHEQFTTHAEQGWHQNYIRPLFSLSATDALAALGWLTSKKADFLIDSFTFITMLMRTQSTE